MKMRIFYRQNFYAFHKNKRKKNFDAKELLKQRDLNDNQKIKLLDFLKKDEKRDGDGKENRDQKETEMECENRN